MERNNRLRKFFANIQYFEETTNIVYSQMNESTEEVNESANKVRLISEELNTMTLEMKKVLNSIHEVNYLTQNINSTSHLVGEAITSSIHSTEQVNHAISLINENTMTQEQIVEVLKQSSNLLINAVKELHDTLKQYQH